MENGLKLNQCYESGLKKEVITEVFTQRGYLQVLEYILHDKCYLHIVNYHFNKVLDENSLPKANSKSFHKEKDIALMFAENIAKELLKQY